MKYNNFSLKVITRKKKSSILKSAFNIYVLRALFICLQRKPIKMKKQTSIQLSETVQKFFVRNWVNKKEYGQNVYFDMCREFWLPWS